MSGELIERLRSYYVVHGGEPLFSSDKKVHKAADLHEAVEEIVRLRHDVALAREGYHTAYAEFDAKCRVVNRQAAEIRDLRAELSSLRGEGETRQGETLYMKGYLKVPCEVERDPERAQSLREACAVLSRYSADPAGTPTRDALVFLNAAISPGAALYFASLPNAGSDDTHSSTKGAGRQA